MLRHAGAHQDDDDDLPIARLRTNRAAAAAASDDDDNLPLAALLVKQQRAQAPKQPEAAASGDDDDVPILLRRAPPPSAAAAQPLPTKRKHTKKPAKSMRTKRTAEGGEPSRLSDADRRARVAAVAAHDAAAPVARLMVLDLGRVTPEAARAVAEALLRLHAPGRGFGFALNKNLLRTQGRTSWRRGQPALIELNARSLTQVPLSPALWHI